VITSCIVLVVAVVLTSDLRLTHERILRNALAKSGSTVLRAAQEAEMDKGQFTRTIQLIEGSHKRLAMQPVEFWQWFAVEIAAEFGLPAELQTATRLERAVRSTHSEMEMAS
jgi:hypothetical protein